MLIEFRWMKITAHMEKINLNGEQIDDIKVQCLGDVKYQVQINDWVNNREAGDLSRHRAHYDVILMDQNV